LFLIEIFDNFLLKTFIINVIIIALKYNKMEGIIKMLLKLLSQIGFLKRKVKSSENYSNEEGIVYVKGEKKPYTGVIENYDLNGVLKIRNRYKKGKLDDFTEYYENGKLQKDVMYKNGIKEGLYREYYEENVITFG